MQKQRPLRIGIEAQRLYRPHKHGMDIVALELIRHLQEIDQTNEYFIFMKPDSDDKVVRETANFKLVEVDGSPYPIWEQVKLPQAAKQHQIDVLHCTSNTAPLNSGVPLVITLHDIIYLESVNLTKGTWYQRIGNMYRRWNVPRVIPACQQVLTVSEYEQKRIVQHFGLSEKQVEVVYNSVGDHFKVSSDIEAIAAIKSKYNLPDRFIFFLANTDPKKNLIGVLKAMALLKAKGQLQSPLVMLDYAEENLTAMLTEIGAPELRADIKLCGYVPNKELPYIFNLSSLFLYPSLRESFGIPILEAMACGSPVITSNTSSMPEVAGGAALLIDPFDPQTIADAIQRVETEPALRQQLIVRGLERVRKFSWARTAEQVKGIYESVYHKSLVSSK